MVALVVVFAPYWSVTVTLTVYVPFNLYACVGALDPVTVVPSPNDQVYNRPAAISAGPSVAVTLKWVAAPWVVVAGTVS
jgi:hypothetical protein